MIKSNGYEYQTDEKTGKTIAISTATGEILEAKTILCPYGTIAYTPEEQEIYKERKKQEHKRALRREISRQLGSFYFVDVHAGTFDNLKPETMARLIYLYTFIGYDGRIMLTQRTQMKYKDLPSVLNISKATVSRFWDEVSPKYLFKNNDKTICVNNSIAKKGRVLADVKSVDEYANIRYCKIYTNGVRALYSTSKRSQHRQIGYIFKLLPFINVEYNLVCRDILDVLEDSIENITPATMYELCKMINYDVTHINELARIYQQISFDVNGKKEKFCSLIYNDTDKRNAYMCINPHVLYSGSDYKKVEVLGMFNKK